MINIIPVSEIRARLNCGYEISITAVGASYFVDNNIHTHTQIYAYKKKYIILYYVRLRSVRILNIEKKWYNAVAQRKHWPAVFILGAPGDAVARENSDKYDVALFMFIVL